MTAPGLAGAPITKTLIFTLITSSILISLLDIKHYFYISPDPHFTRWSQYWRVFTWQTCYLNSSEVLFAVICLHNLRGVERIWGSRKLGVSALVSRNCGQG
jgi:hypothetical protein